MKYKFCTIRINVTKYDVTSPQGGGEVTFSFVLVISFLILNVNLNSHTGGIGEVDQQCRGNYFRTGGGKTKSAKACNAKYGSLL